MQDQDDVRTIVDDPIGEEEGPVRVIELGKRKKFTSKDAPVPQPSSRQSVYFTATSFGTMGQTQFRLQDLPPIPGHLTRTAVEFKFRPMMELISGMTYRIVLREHGRTRISQGVIPQSDIAVGYIQALIARPNAPGCRVWLTIETMDRRVVATSTSVQMGRQR